jgi:O-antigen/teichoic acid export membrane protein
MTASELPGRRRLVARGIAWNTLYQVFEAGVAFGAMLIIVRIIPPAEYGRFGAALGLLMLLNSFSFGNFVSQALQLPDGREPDWSLHWSVGMYIQVSLMLACHALAGLCWLTSTYRPIAPLLHVAALGFIIDWPARLRAAMLRREMDFRRSKILLACSTALQLSVTIAVGLLGGGALAIVLGSNVVTPTPFVVDLLLVRRWRPRPGWWRWPDWGAYRPALRFGLQQVGGALVWSVRGALEGIVLPRTVGYASVGLMDRAHALASRSIGRVSGIMVETIYPLLPRCAAELTQYVRQSTIFAQALLLVVIPAVLYIGLEGPSLSRLLYGKRWIDADPLIWPAAVSGLGLSLFALGSVVLLAQNRLRLCFVLEAVAAAVSLPMLAVTFAGYGIVAYAWTLAAGRLLAGVIALAAASPLLAAGWMRSALVPPTVASLLAMTAVLAVERLGIASSLVATLCLDTWVYGLVLVLSLRGLFPGSLGSVLSRVPGGERLGGWLRLSVGGAVPAAP